MRRLTLALLFGTLALSACSDQSRESPTEPSVEPDASLRGCRPPAPFPLGSVSAQIVKIFPPGRLRVEALARVIAIKILWETCRRVPAQKAAVAFIDWTNQNFQAGKLIGSAQQVSTLFTTVLTGVGLSSLPQPPVPGPDFGVGFFDPASTTPTVVKTVSGVALTELVPGSFTEPTAIVIARRPDDSPLNNFDGDQFPPFFDYSASNGSGVQVLSNGPTAIVAFCLLTDVVYPDEVQIGHNPPAGAPGSPFEILEPVDPIPQNLLDQLQCANLQPNTGSEVSTFGGGWSRFARAIARTLLLPQELRAATLAKTGSIGGKAGSFSPFGVVLASPISYGATGYRYLLSSSFPGGVPPAGFETAGFDDSGWPLGDAAFGHDFAGDNCTLNQNGSVETDWPSSSQILLRRSFIVPGGGSSATVSVAIDNDVKVFVNGTNITNTAETNGDPVTPGADGFVAHEGCPEQGSFTFTASGLDPGVNLIVIQARDRGRSTYVDVEVTPPGE